jgi:uncharacterized protein (TIGR03066 family)
MIGLVSASADLGCPMTATAVLCVLLAAPAAPIPKERAEAEKVVGTWKLVKSTNPNNTQPSDLLLELSHGGKLVIRQTSNGRTAVYEGEYKLMKDEIPYSVKYPGGGVKKETLKIKKLTDAELIVVDPDGIQEDFVRVKSEKEKEKKDGK